MRLDHINLCASDVPALTRTLSEHLGFEVLQEGIVPGAPWASNPGAAFSFLVGEDGSGPATSAAGSKCSGRRGQRK